MRKSPIGGCEGATGGPAPAHPRPPGEGGPPARRHRGLKGLRGAARGASPGLSLVETLTAMFVLAVGALGLASGQGVAVAANRAALHRSEAVAAMADIIERARANPAGNYDTPLGGAPPAFRDCIASACTPAQLAAFDVATWKCALGAWEDAAPCVAAQAALAAFAPAISRLPEGDASFTTSGGEAVVVVQWRARGRPNPVQVRLRTWL